MRKIFILVLLLNGILLFAQSESDDLFTGGREAFSSKSYDVAIGLFDEFLDLYPEDSRADGVNYMRSVSYFYRKQYLDSINSFRLFKTDYRDSAYNSRVSYWLGLCSYALKNFSDAAEFFQKQTEYTNESFFVNRSYLYLGESYEKLSRPDKAEQAYLAGIRSGGEEKITSMNRLKLGIIFFNSGNYSGAREQFSEIINTSIETSLVSDSQYYIGESLYHMGELRDAASKLQFYLFMSTNNKFREAAVFRLGDIYQSLQMSDEAVKYLQLLKSDYPGGEYYLDGLRVLGTTYRSVNDLKKAAAVFEEIIDLTADEIEKQNYYFELAQIKIDSNIPLEAVALLKESLKGPDEDMQEMSLFYLGQLLMDNNLKDEGAAYLFELINRFPEGDTTDDASLTLSDYLVQNGDTHRLTLFVGSQLNRQGKYQDRFLLLKGDLDEREGNYEEAELSYDRIINDISHSEYLSSAIHRKAKLFVKKGNNEEAITLLDRALRNSGEEGEKTNILVDKAILLYSMGDMERADYAFRVLLDKDSDFPRKEEILFRKGELSLEARDYREAAEYFRKAAESSSGNDSIVALFNMGKSYFFNRNYRTSERIYLDLSEKLLSTSDQKTEAMKMTALSIFLQQEWKRTLQYSDLMVTSLGVYPGEIRLLKLLSLLALGRDESFHREVNSLNLNQKENIFLVNALNQLGKTDFSSLLLIFRSLLAAYPYEDAKTLLVLLLTDMIYITSDEQWILETYDLIAPHLEDKIQIIGFNQAYQMNKPQ